jgi:hypothetical protein
MIRGALGTVVATMIVSSLPSCGSSSNAPAPDGGDASPGPDGRDASPGPDGRDASPAPDGGDASPGPDGRDASPAPDGGDADLVPTGAPATASAFCALEREQTAAFSARCLGGPAGDWKALRDSYLPCARFDELVAAGTVRYHADLALDCLEANSADRDCFAPENFCYTRTLEGLLAPNAPCKNDYECPGNAGCWAPTEFGFNACAQSVCVTVGDKVGDPCLLVPFCYPGVVTCVNGACVSYSDKGAACGAGQAPCAPGLVCDGATGTCLPMSQGSACVGDFDCIGTHYCALGQCQPRLEVGSPCGAAPTGCVGFAACNPQTTLCEAAGHLDQACGSTMGSANLCIGGSCQLNAQGSASCLAPHANGGGCNVGAQCASGGCAGNVCSTCPP